MFSNAHQRIFVSELTVQSMKMCSVSDEEHSPETCPVTGLVATDGLLLSSLVSHWVASEQTGMWYMKKTTTHRGRINRSFSNMCWFFHCDGIYDHKMNTAIVKHG